MLRELIFVGACFITLLPMSTQGAATQGAAGLVPPKVEIQPKPLTREVIDLVRSSEASKHEKARTLLADKNYLLRLNTEQEYLALPAESLQLHLILDALCDNSSKEATETINLLAGNSLYSDAAAGLPQTQTLLLLSSRKVASAPANLQRFWKDQLKPEADDLHLAVETLVANGSAEAIKVLEESLRQNEYEPDFVVAWFRDPFLKHRQDPRLLEMCDRLLRSENWSSDLKPPLIEALFEYRPKAWYTQENEPPKPPGRAALSPAARQKLGEIAELALAKGWINQDQHSRIKQELQAK